MRILVACGSYKSTMSSTVATEIVATELQQMLPEATIQKLVLADGGEGTLEMFQQHFGTVFKNHIVHDPLGNLVSADIGYIDETNVIIETSQAIGLSLIKSKSLNPYLATSYGIGELINIACKDGAKKILVSMGDSATLDMGVGMLQALGVKFYSSNGEITNPNLNNLIKIIDFDISSLRELLRNTTFVGLVDTNDFLCGEIGQVQLYARQKGLRDQDVSMVEDSFSHFSSLIKERLGADVINMIRTSGSGGLAATLHAFLGANLVNTLDYLSDQLHFDRRISEADITITGEGCLDNQTKQGKVPYYVAARSSGHCIGIFGKYTSIGLDDIVKVCPRFSVFSMNPECSIDYPNDSLKQIARSIGSLLQL